MRRLSVFVIALMVTTAIYAPIVQATSGPQRVRDLGTNELVQTFTPIGNKILFSADDGVHGRELYVSDGTYEGTGLVKDIRPGSGSSLIWSAGSDNPNSFIAAGDRAYFLATDGVNGIGLYVSDGTDAGTVRLIRRRPCTNGANGMVVAGARLFFTSESTGGGGNCNLYSTDGTVLGTTLAVTGMSAFSQPVYFNGRVYFLGGGGTSKTELWKTPAQPDGTLKRIRTFNAGIDQLTVAGTRLYFTTGVTASSGARLWKSNGTRPGTRLVNKSQPLSATDLTPFNGTLVFGVWSYLGNGVWDKSLWRTNGSDAGTKMLTDFGTDKYSSVSRLWVASNRIFMLAGTDLPAYGLWTTDGKTTAGTHFVAKMNFNSAAAVGNDMYGSGCYRDATAVPVGCGFGDLFMTSDGTNAGSHDIPGAVNLLPDVAVADGVVFLNVNGELWSYTP